MTGPRPTRALIESSLNRSAWLERPGAGPPRFVKRFEHSGALGRLRDRARAEREARLLAALAARGLPVPRPLGVSADRRAVELAMQAIEGALPADRLPDGAWPGQGALAEQAGRLLAGLYAAGVVHGDLHLANLLVERGLRLWLVDLGHARNVASVGRRRALADLARLAGIARERWPARARSRFLRGCRRALPAELARRFGEPRRLAAEAEALAPALRRRSVQRHLDRWERPSGLMRSVDAAPGALLVRADRAGDWRRSIGDADWSGLGAPYLVHAAPRRTLLAGWRALARLVEHRVPACVPLALDLGRRRALYEIPERGATRHELARALADRLGRRGALRDVPTPDGGRAFAPASC
jgi:tRNA A-37 threonylcarbamoyl transferase component Bud32